MNLEIKLTFEDNGSDYELWTFTSRQGSLPYQIGVIILVTMGGKTSQTMAIQLKICKISIEFLEIDAL